VKVSVIHKDNEIHFKRRGFESFGSTDSTKGIEGRSFYAGILVISGSVSYIYILPGL